MYIEIHIYNCRCLINNYMYIYIYNDKYIFIHDLIYTLCMHKFTYNYILNIYDYVSRISHFWKYPHFRR